LSAFYQTLWIVLPALLAIENVKCLQYHLDTPHDELTDHQPPVVGLGKRNSILLVHREAGRPGELGPMYSSSGSNDKPNGDGKKSAVMNGRTPYVMTRRFDLGRRGDDSKLALSSGASEDDKRIFNYIVRDPRPEGNKKNPGKFSDYFNFNSGDEGATDHSRSNKKKAEQKQKPTGKNLQDQGRGNKLLGDSLRKSLKESNTWTDLHPGDGDEGMGGKTNLGDEIGLVQTSRVGEREALIGGSDKILLLRRFPIMEKPSTLAFNHPVSKVVSVPLFLTFSVLFLALVCAKEKRNKKIKTIHIFCVYSRLFESSLRFSLGI
jgi:hypothetical protein